MQHLSTPKSGLNPPQISKLDSTATTKDNIRDDPCRGVKRKLDFDSECKVDDCCVGSEEVKMQKNIWKLKRGEISLHTYNTLLAEKDPFMKPHYVPRQKDAVIVRFVATQKSHILGDIIPNDLVDTDWKFLLDRIPQVCDDFRSNTVSKNAIFIIS